MEELELEALSASVSARFDDVPWQGYNSGDMTSRAETRAAVLTIEADLTKIAQVDTIRAREIWDAHVPDFVPRPAAIRAQEVSKEPDNAVMPDRKRRKRRIDPVFDRVDDPQREMDRTQPKTRQGDEAGAPSDRDVARNRMLLEGLTKQYLKADERYHFRGGSSEVAFEAAGGKLVTRFETPSVVASMLDLAETRGWSSLKVEGTPSFRREAWLQGAMRGIEVKGYRADALGKARLEELRQERAAPGIDRGFGFKPTAQEGRGEPRLPLRASQAQFLGLMEATMRRRGDSELAIDKARNLAADKLTTSRLYLGRLTETGTAPYRDQPGGPESHFVVLTAEGGARVKVWGVDLPRALADSKAKLGETVVLAFQGQTVVRPAPGKELERTTSSERKPIYRNNWLIIPFEPMLDEAKALVRSALERQERPARLKIFDQLQTLSDRQRAAGADKARHSSRSI